jgi:large subunit ribosomal protein L25
MSKSARASAAKAMIVDWQYEPIKDTADPHRPEAHRARQDSARQRAVKLLGVPVGVKNEGGILDQVLREVEIECLPADIPSHIDVDVSNLGMHGVIRVSDLPHSDKIKF